MDYGKLFRLDGRRVAVVGGASGIGREAARALVAHGAHVVVADRDGEGAERTAALATGAADGGDTGAADAGDDRPTAAAPGPVPPQEPVRDGPAPRGPRPARLDAGTAVAYPLDVLDPDAVRAAVAAWEPLDGLVVTVGTNVRKRLADYGLDEFDRVIALNLRSYLTLIQAVAPGMAERGRGSVVGFASMRAFQVEPGQGPYAASKAGLIQLLRTAAAEWGPRGVRFNAVAPGVVRTPLTDQIAADPAWFDAYAQASALKRWARADELAGAVTYLVSDASTFVTGTVLSVDGGWTAVDGRYDPSV